MMTTSKVYEERYPLPDQVRNNGPAVAEVARSFAGRSRHLWELAHGASAVPDEPPAIGRNPQGLRGVDWSGPPFGPCLLIPVAIWQGRSGGAGVIAPQTPLSAIGSIPGVLSPWRIWNRPHVVHDDDSGPLQQLALLWQATASAGTSSTFEVRIANRTNSRTTTLSRVINTATSTQYTEAQLFPFAPGENIIDLFVSRTAGTRTLNVESLCLAVVAKRKHGLSFPG